MSLTGSATIWCGFCDQKRSVEVADLSTVVFGCQCSATTGAQCITVSFSAATYPDWMVPRKTNQPKGPVRHKAHWLR